MEWLQTHTETVLQLLGAVVALATIIVKLTPTAADDTVLANLIKVLSAFSLCNADGSFIGRGEK